MMTKPVPDVSEETTVYIHELPEYSKFNGAGRETLNGLFNHERFKPVVNEKILDCRKSRKQHGIQTSVIRISAI